MFERLKPYFVKINKSFETCCCRYHVTFDLYYEGFRKMIEESGGTSQNTFPKRPSQFITSILCDKPNDCAIGEIDCIRGTCETCGNLTKFPLREEDTNMTRMVKCKRYKYIKSETKAGKESTRLEYVEDEISAGEFMSNFHKLIQPYIRMHFLLSGKQNNFKH